MAAKAKNSKKQQQAVATAMVIPNPFVVPDEILGKISTAAASPLSDMNVNSNSSTPNMKQDQPLAVLPNVVISSRSSPAMEAKQLIILDDLKDWADQMEMESTVPPQFLVQLMLVLGRISLFQLLPGCIGLKSVLQDAVKLFCVEFASQESLNGATRVAISNDVFLTTLKIAWSSGVASVSSPFLLVALCDVPLDTSPDDIKTALGIFGDISSAAAALSNWSVLVRKDSVRILPIANQKEVISSRDAFKAKLVNFLFSCTAFEISDLVSQVGDHTCFIPCSPESYRRQCFAAAAFVVPSGAAAADMELDLGGFPKTATPVLSAVPSVPNTAVESRLASLESHFSELSVLIKSLVEPVGALVALVTKLLSTSSAIDVSVKECVDGLAKQNTS
ncbi:hypothetical protein G9A89_005565 [Geosiphon pyriformis]|nr:hypothetical protein G9A89_005565 [Geosiphon pyriformis]